MQVSFHRPGAALGDCVAGMVHFAGFLPDWQREKLLPDGAMELVVDLADRPKRLFRDETDPRGTDFRRAWISGVHRRPIVIEAQPMAALLVISFTPGGAYPFLGCDADALTDGVFALEDVLGRAAASLRDRVLEAGTPAAMFAAAEAWLRERAGGPGGGEPLIGLLAGRMAAGNQPIRELMEMTGRSERHLQALEAAHARMRRFQRLLADIGPRPDWADLAATHGYFDQAHLGHEFRAFAGMTPGAYARDHAGTLDYLPIRTPPERGFLQDRLAGSG